jgi:hypothetical protein
VQDKNERKMKRKDENLGSILCVLCRCFLFISGLLYIAFLPFVFRLGDSAVAAHARCSIYSASVFVVVFALLRAPRSHRHMALPTCKVMD